MAEREKGKARGLKPFWEKIYEGGSAKVFLAAVDAYRFSLVSVDGVRTLRPEIPVDTVLQCLLDGDEVAGLLALQEGVRLVAESLEASEPERFSGDGCVYFAQCGEDDYSSMVKIGFTSKSDDPAHRIAELQVGNPFKINLIASVHGVNVLYEQALHSVFRPLHIRGEWFSDSVMIRSFIAETAILHSASGGS